MPMRFAMRHLENASDDDLIPELPWLPWELSDQVIQGLVKNNCLQPDETNDPRKVLDAIEWFLKVGMGLVMAQKVTTTRQ